MSNKEKQPVIPQQGKAKLQGNMGVAAVVLTVLAFSAPLSTATGPVPVLLSMSGPSAGWIYVIGTVVFGLFAIGFAKMGTVMTRPGGFYSYVTDGLGKKFGMMEAMTAAVAYTCTMFGGPLLGITVGGLIESLGGPSIPWIVIAIISVALTTLFGWLKIDFSAKVLTIVMICECLIIIIFDLFSFVSGAYTTNGGITMPWPDLGIHTPFGIALLFGLTNFMGFEATVVYREEVRNPEKTIPRATLGAVFFIGIFYFVLAIAFTACFGANGVREAAQGAVGTLFVDSMGIYCGKIFVDCIAGVAIFSVFASMLAVHNVASRYWYSLGTDGVMPKALGKAHPKNHSPYIAQTTVGIVWAIAYIIFYIIKPDEPAVVYELFTGAAGELIMIIIFVAAIAVFAYFRKNNHGFGIWQTTIAPGLAVVGLALCEILCLFNFDQMSGASKTMTAIFWVLVVILLVGSYAKACWYQKHKPDVYARIGRMDPDSSEE